MTFPYKLKTNAGGFALILPKFTSSTAILTLEPLMSAHLCKNYLRKGQDGMFLGVFALVFWLLL
jgi:hypothetical protein